MFSQLLQYQDIGWLILRLAIAIIFIVHALSKLMKPAMMASDMGMPTAGIMMLGLVEFLSSVGLIFGVYTQFASLLLAFVMLGAIYFKKFKWRVPFFAMDKTGWEFDFILLAANIAILFGGGWSIKIF